MDRDVLLPYRIREVIYRLKRVTREGVAPGYVKVFPERMVRSRRRDEVYVHVFDNLSAAIHKCLDYETAVQIAKHLGTEIIAVTCVSVIPDMSRKITNYHIHDKSRGLTSHFLRCCLRCVDEMHDVTQVILSGANHYYGKGNGVVISTHRNPITALVEAMSLLYRLYEWMLENVDDSEPILNEDEDEDEIEDIAQSLPPTIVTPIS
jgi:hypothetical protein